MGKFQDLEVKVYPWAEGNTPPVLQGTCRAGCLFLSLLSLLGTSSHPALLGLGSLPRPSLCSGGLTSSQPPFHVSLPLMLNQACFSPGTGRGSASQVGGGGHSFGVSQRSKLKQSSSLPQKTPQNPKQQPRMYLRRHDFLASWPQKNPLYLY